MYYLFWTRVKGTLGIQTLLLLRSCFFFMKRCFIMVRGSVGRASNQRYSLATCWGSDICRAEGFGGIGGFCFLGCSDGKLETKYLPVVVIVRSMDLYIIMLQTEAEVEGLWRSVDHNQDTVLQGLDALADVYQGLADLSGLLYDGQNAYPLEIYRSFRLVFESTRSVSTIFEGYEANSQKFQVERKELVRQHCGVMNTIVSFQHLGDSDQGDGIEKHRSRGQEDRVLYLQGEIAALNQLLQNNNRDFQQEIQNYNHRLYDFKQTIQRYQQQLQRAQEVEVLVDNLENRLMVAREEKERDLMVIEQGFTDSATWPARFVFLRRKGVAVRLSFLLGTSSLHYPQTVPREWQLLVVIFPPIIEDRDQTAFVSELSVSRRFKSILQELMDSQLTEEEDLTPSHLHINFVQKRRNNGDLIVVVVIFNKIKMMPIGSASFQIPPRSTVMKLAAVNDGSFLVTYKTMNLETKRPNCYFEVKSIHQYCKKKPLTRQYSFPTTIIDFLLTDNLKVVVLMRGEKALSVIDLERQTKAIVPFGIKIDQMGFSSRIIHFKQTNLIGLIVSKHDNGSNGDFYLKFRKNEGIQTVKNIKGASNKEEGGLVVSYFSFVKGELKTTIMQNMSSKGINILGKGNNHSMVVFYKEKELELILVEVVKLEGGKESSRVRKINFNSESSFFLCWQIATDQLAIFPRLKDILKRIKVLDLSNGQSRQIQPHFTGPELLDSDFDGTLCKPIIMKDCICLLSSKLRSSNKLPSPFLNIYKKIFQGMVFIEVGASNMEVSWLEGQENENTRVNVCDYDNSILLFANTSKRVMTVEKRMKFPLKNIYMQFMLHLNQDLDDDLLLDAMIALGFE